MNLTLEYVAACRLKAAAREMDGAAGALVDVGGKIAKQHAKEMRGAAKIARQWAKELMDLHEAKQQNLVDIYEAYETWPADIKKKLSCHDLRRMSGWAPPGNVDEWEIDTSTPLANPDLPEVQRDPRRASTLCVEPDPKEPREA